MPHIIVEPFERNKLDALVKDGTLCTMYAISDNRGVELLGVDEEGEFFLEIKYRSRDVLIKSDPITRPLDSNRIKRALRRLIQEGNLKVINSNIALSNTKPKISSLYYKTINDFEDIAFPFDKVALEVGFGSGRHLLWQGKENPNTLFIGIEIHTPSAEQVLKQITLQNIKNIWVVNYDARLLLEMLPSNLLEAIYVHFPVPWDKKPHRRVISDSFVKEALRTLTPNGILELRTDSNNYYKYALDVFSRPVKVNFKIEKNRDLAVVSKYEARWRRMQKDIYTLTLYGNTLSSEKKNDYNFTFKSSLDLNRVESLAKHSYVREDYFIHFGSHYRRLDGCGGLIECSFGSFDRPEHKYLRYDKIGLIQYFPANPVKIATNYKAHKEIGDMING